jgi:hypothetical protein
MPSIKSVEFTITEDLLKAQGDVLGFGQQRAELVQGKV